MQAAADAPGAFDANADGGMNSESPAAASGLLGIAIGSLARLIDEQDAAARTFGHGVKAAQDTGEELSLQLRTRLRAKPATLRRRPSPPPNR